MDEQMHYLFAQIMYHLCKKKGAGHTPDALDPYALYIYINIRFTWWGLAAEVVSVLTSLITESVPVFVMSFGV